MKKDPNLWMKDYSSVCQVTKIFKRFKLLRRVWELIESESSFKTVLNDNWT